MNNIISMLLLCCSTMLLHAVEFSSSIEHKNSFTQTVAVSCKLDNNEAILANSLQASIDNPDLKIGKLTVNIPSKKEYLPKFQQKKHIYDQDFIITIDVQAKQEQATINAFLHVNYLSTLKESILDVQIPIHFTCLSEENNELIHDQEDKTPELNHTNLASQENNASWSTNIQNLVEHTKSPWTQILLAFLLGLLLSLTPCIYPMIPITIGILHSQGRKSLFHDFLGSLSYAAGMATTFACLGLLATLAGSSFGSLLSYPPFVIALVLFIGYMSLTMIGVIDMYIPSFMRGQVTLHKNLGPCLAAYLFGAISGTVASPCVSPGLALLLSIVATLGNTFLGFLLLFAFGMGLSTPLIIIGTFSNALYLLPQSGMWMVEIKKGLGFFMLATCFYYLSNILPIILVYWLGTGFTLAVAGFYLQGASDKNNPYKSSYTLISIIMISATIMLAIKSYEKTFYKEQIIQDVSIDWQPNYRIALDLAKENNKLLLIDFWAQHCTICKAIDKKVFHNEQFYKALSNNIVFVKIDATHTDNSEYQHARKLYKVYAQPTILLVDPTTETVVKKWTSEPYNMPITTFIDEIKKLQK
ncbi:MAG: protein-disulfide reductase DsbD family protein [Candidatus Chromulinivorax sp.]